MSNTSAINILRGYSTLTFAHVGLRPSEEEMSWVKEKKAGVDSLFDSDGFNLNESRGVSRLKASKLVHG